jgi:hypothetical protein
MRRNRGRERVPSCSQATSDVLPFGASRIGGGSGNPIFLRSQGEVDLGLWIFDAKSEEDKSAKREALTSRAWKEDRGDDKGEWPDAENGVHGLAGRGVAGVYVPPPTTTYRCGR